MSKPLATRRPHFPAKAKQVICLHMSGATPHLDLFDYKPELVKRTGQDCPDDYLNGKRFAFTSVVPKLLGTPRTFKQLGRGGVWMFDALSHLHSVADELCVVKSIKTDEINPAPAELLLFTGSPRQGWPGIRSGLTKKCVTMDKPVAALIRDLKRLGMLDDTLVVWSGEFGRTPFREGRTAGSTILSRDYFPDCYTVFLTGAGVKGGHTHGQTHELGFGVTENPVHVHDLQATVLHLLGLNYERLTYRFQGRDYRLADVHGYVVRDILSA